LDRRAVVDVLEKSKAAISRTQDRLARADWASGIPTGAISRRLSGLPQAHLVCNEICKCGFDTVELLYLFSPQSPYLTL